MFCFQCHQRKKHTNQINSNYLKKFNENHSKEHAFVNSIKNRTSVLFTVGILHKINKKQIKSHLAYFWNGKSLTRTAERFSRNNKKTVACYNGDRNLFTSKLKERPTSKRKHKANKTVPKRNDSRKDKLCKERNRQKATPVLNASLL